MSGKNQLFKSGKTIRLQWDFRWSRISAGFGKSAGFRIPAGAEIRYSPNHKPRARIVETKTSSGQRLTTDN